MHMYVIVQHGQVPGLECVRWARRSTTPDGTSRKQVGNPTRSYPKGALCSVWWMLLEYSRSHVLVTRNMGSVRVREQGNCPRCNVGPSVPSNAAITGFSMSCNKVVVPLNLMIRCLITQRGPCALSHAISTGRNPQSSPWKPTTRLCHQNEPPQQRNI